MFTNLFSEKRFQSKTGFFKVEGKSLIAIEETPGNGSINSVIESLGYPKNHIYTVNTFDSKEFHCLGFKTLSKELIFVLAKSPETKISFSDVSKAISQIDWGFEYSSLNVEDILNEGIDLENLDLEFLKSVLDLKFEDDNLYRSERLGLYLQFNNGVLKAIASSGWDNSSTKWLNDVNSLMVKRMLEEATLYQNNKIEAMEEVNKQADSLLNIPSAVQNEYISFHQKKNGNVNYYNLLITHYDQYCDLDEFLFMNKGRYKKIDERTFEVGRFTYYFDADEKLEKVVEI